MSILPNASSARSIRARQSASLRHIRFHRQCASTSLPSLFSYALRGVQIEIRDDEIGTLSEETGADPAPHAAPAPGDDGYSALQTHGQISIRWA